MSLRDYARKNLVTCPPDALIQEVACLMKDNDVGTVLVVADERPVGIVTDRDIVIRCTAMGVNCAAVTAQETMTVALETVFENESIYEVAERMRAARVRRIPVVDRHGRAVSLLSLDDVFQLLVEEMNDLKKAIAPANAIFISRSSAA